MATKAKFCANCGNKLTGGKCENCAKSSGDDLKTTSSFTFQDIITVYKNIIPRPISTLRSIVKKGSMGLAWTLIVIASIFSGLSCYFVYLRASTLAGNNTIFLDSFWTIFFTAAVLNIIIYALLSLWSAIFLGSGFKNGGTFRDYLLINAGASAFTVLFSIISTVFGLANLPLIALIIEGFAFLVCVILIVQGYRDVAKNHDNTFAYGLSLAVLVTGIIAGVITVFAVYQLQLNVTTNAVNKTYNEQYQRMLNSWGY